MTASDRPPLDAAEVQQALAPAWRRVEVVEETTSTNEDLGARIGTPEAVDHTLRAAEFQFAGRGRLQRSWVSPPRTGITVSLLLDCTALAVPTTVGWLPLLFGVAAVDAVREQTGVHASLKWPNDLLVGAARHKLGGILGQLRDGWAVLGLGLNVSSTPADLPVPTATSLALNDARSLDRTALLIALARSFESHYQRWLAAGGDPTASGLAEAYLAVCVTVGCEVVVDLGTERLAGTARGVDEYGRLLVRSDGALHPVAAGEVQHVVSF